MTATIRLVATVVGLAFVVFAVVVAVYANEPFNIATLFGIAGLGMIGKLYWSRREPGPVSGRGAARRA